MDKLTCMIEAILFASGKAVSFADIADKLGVTTGEVSKSLNKLTEKYSGESGIHLLVFNKKAQLATNPEYKDAVFAVLNLIREKELTRVLLECAAIIAYKQPITRSEIEMLRGISSDYAVNALLDLNLIYPSGRKDAIGHPVLYSTTDEFLKRFKLNSLADLPDYDELMAALRPDDDQDTYLYARSEYEGDGDTAPTTEEDESKPAEEKKKAKKEDDDSEKIEIPDFLKSIDESDLVKIS